MSFRLHTLFQSLRYLIVSGSGAGVNLAAFALGRLCGLPPVVCGALAFLAACQHNLYWHARFTFDAEVRADLGRSARFFLISLATLGLNLALLTVLRRAGMSTLLAQGVAIAGSCPINFLGSRLWVFIDGPPPAAAHRGQSDMSMPAAAMSNRAYA